LMVLHDARRAARVDPSGRWVALDAQDRALWDHERLRLGLATLARAVRLRRPGEYQLQAAITALQIQAPNAETTDWPQIAELYGALAALNPSPVIELNRLVSLTPRDSEVAMLIIEGLSDREIAERLYLSHYTVHQYVKRIYRKLDVDSRVALTRLLLGVPIGARRS
jgi:RNA polymerase sigma-70 factor, ECF subfamily